MSKCHNQVLLSIDCFTHFRDTRNFMIRMSQAGRPGIKWLSPKENSTNLKTLHIINLKSTCCPAALPPPSAIDIITGSAFLPSHLSRGICLVLHVIFTTLCFKWKIYYSIKTGKLKIRALKLRTILLLWWRGCLPVCLDKDLPEKERSKLLLKITKSVCCWKFNCAYGVPGPTWKSSDFRGTLNGITCANPLLFNLWLRKKVNIWKNS